MSPKTKKRSHKKRALSLVKSECSKKLKAPEEISGGASTTAMGAAASTSTSATSGATTSMDARRHVGDGLRWGVMEQNGPSTNIDVFDREEEHSPKLKALATQLLHAAAKDSKEQTKAREKKTPTTYSQFLKRSHDAKLFQVAMSARCTDLAKQLKGNADTTYKSNLDTADIPEFERWILDMMFDGIPHGFVEEADEKHLDADQNSAYGEILFSNFVKGPLSPILSKARTFADLGMGRGFAFYQIMATYRNIKCGHGFEIIPDRFNCALSIFPRAAIMDMWTTDPTEKEDERHINISLASGLTHPHPETVDFWLFDIQLNEKSVVSWSTFFKQTKSGCHVLSFKSPDSLVSKGIFAQNEWKLVQMIPLAVTWDLFKNAEFALYCKCK
jgi:hypothetical protein